MWALQAVTLDPRDLKARAVLAMAERVAGRLDDAQRRIDAVAQEMPIDYLALSEQHEISKAGRDEAKSRRASRDLWRLLAREPDSVLEVAFDYAACGRRDEPRRILEEAIRRAREGTREKRASPMLHYALGHFFELDGDLERAHAQYALGAKEDPAFVFPHRVAEIEVLRAARAANPNDGRAAYYLGNALASNNRDEEALAAWRDAVRLDPSNTVARRNLARALWVVAGEKEEAAAQYQEAIATAPGDYRLYVETASLLHAIGQQERRVAVLEGAPQAIRSHATVVEALAAAYVGAGRFADAVALLASRTFASGEGEERTLSLYRRAHLGLARQHLQAGDNPNAAEEFIKATEYPRNLGVGRPGMQSQAREYVAAARALEAAGRREEAERWWQRAAREPLNSPTQPLEPWSEHYFYKAAALEHIGQPDEARALYERLARLADEGQMLEAEPSPPTGAIRFALAGAGLRALGRPGEARAALERALQIDPLNELARAQLSELRDEAR